MGKNMKKSKQNIVARVKDFKKTRVKVGRKLKNIVETIPKVKVAKICIRSQFTEDNVSSNVALLLDDKHQAPRTNTNLPPSLSRLQKLSDELINLLKQTQTGKKTDTRRDSMASLLQFLSTQHPFLTSANLVCLLESLCVLIVDATSFMRTEAARLLRLVLGKMTEAKGLTNKGGLDWTIDNSPMLMAYIFRAMSNTNLNSTSLLSLDAIFDLCPLVAITTSRRISQLLLKMLLHQNASILSTHKNKKQILSIDGDEWSGLELTHQSSPTMHERIAACKYMCKLLKLLLTELQLQRVAHGDYAENLLDEPSKCVLYAADVVKVMAYIFNDVFHLARKRGKGLERCAINDDDADCGGSATIVLLSDGSLEVMTACLNTIIHSFHFINHFAHQAGRCESIVESINLLAASFPYTALLTNHNNNNNKNNKSNFGRSNEVDVGTNLNERMATVLLSFLHHHQTLTTATTAASARPLQRLQGLSGKLLKHLLRCPFAPLPHLADFYSALMGHSSAASVGGGGRVLGGVQVEVGRLNTPKKLFLSNSTKHHRVGRGEEGGGGMRELVVAHAVARMKCLLRGFREGGVVAAAMLMGLDAGDQKEAWETTTTQEHQEIIKEQGKQTPSKTQKSALKKRHESTKPDKALGSLKSRKKEFMFWLRLFPLHLQSSSSRTVNVLASEYLIYQLAITMIKEAEEEEEEDLKFLIRRIDSSMYSSCKSYNDTKTDQEFLKVIIENVQNLNAFLVSESFGRLRACTQRNFFTLLAKSWRLWHIKGNKNKNNNEKFSQDDRNKDIFNCRNGACHNSTSDWNSKGSHEELNVGDGAFVPLERTVLERMLMDGAYGDLLHALVHVSFDETLDGTWDEAVIAYIIKHLGKYTLGQSTEKPGDFSKQQLTIIKISTPLLSRYVSVKPHEESVRYFKLIFRHFHHHYKNSKQPRSFHPRESFIALACLLVRLAGTNFAVGGKQHPVNQCPPLQLSEAALLALGCGTADPDDDGPYAHIQCSTKTECFLLLKHHVKDLFTMITKFDLKKISPNASALKTIERDQTNEMSSASVLYRDLLVTTRSHFGNVFTHLEMQCLTSHLARDSSSQC